nr:transmembrane protein 87B-like [Ziziphus jujuba var. spinosa]
MFETQCGFCLFYMQMRRNMAKLELYRKFTNSLAVSVLLSIAWIGFELYFNATDPLSELWKIAWIIPAFWTLLAYSLLVVICVLWAPSRNPTRYAYSEEAGDELDEEGIALTSSSATNLSGMAAKGDSHIGLGEDLEEDKRE